MCRMCAVLSDEAVLLADFLLRPRMSLVRQSYAAQERRALPQGVLPSMAYQQPFLNADGFGVGWYAPATDAVDDLKQPCVFTSLKPAWNDPNLRNLSLEVRSPLVIAHIRAAGPALPVSDSCCHPFKAGRLLFAHNGMVGDFANVRRELLAGLTSYAFDVVVEHACIDSAVAFGVLLTELGVTCEADAMREWNADELVGGLHRTINRLVTVVAGRDESLLNFLLSDGNRIVACRYATAPSAGGLQDGDEELQPVGATLYLSAGSRWTSRPDDPETFRMRRGADITNGTVILSSEPLTAVREEWLPIAPNSLIICGIRSGQRNNIDILMFGLDAPPAAPLSALLGVEKAAGEMAEATFEHGDDEPALPAGDVSQPSLPESDVWMTLTGHTEDVNCVAPLFDGRIVAAGSMDGTLRLFDIESGQTLVTRRHSKNSGPILALLALDGMPMAEGGSAPSSPSCSPRLEKSPAFADEDGTATTRLGSLDEQLRGTLHSDELPRSRAESEETQLLVSTANNELRIWNISACATVASGEIVDVPCLFCFRFVPNQGQLLSLAGTLDNLALGFQSSRIFRLKLREGWRKLTTCKHKSRSTRYFTCNVDYTNKDTGAAAAGGLNMPIDSLKALRRQCFAGQDAAAAASGLPADCVKAQPKFTHHLLLEPLHGIGTGHIGYVQCLAYEPKSELLASGGGDGRVIFWGRNGQRAAFPHGGAVLALAVRATSGEAFSADARGRIRVWDCATVERGSRAVLSVPGRSTPILALTLAESPCGEGLLLAGASTGVIRIWNINRSCVVREVEAEISCCASLCLLEADVLPRKVARGSDERQWLIRIACGGCSSGHVHVGDLAVHCRDEGQAPSPQTSDVEEVTSSGGSSGSRRGRREPGEFRSLLVLLRQFIAIPTVPRQPKYESHMQKGGVFVAQQLEKLLGCTVRVSGTCIVARCGWDDAKPLVAMYSHYDVVDAGHGWDTDPWTLVAKDGWLIGRGVADNKGPLLAQIFAVRQLLRRGGSGMFKDKPAASSGDENSEITMRIEACDDDEVEVVPPSSGQKSSPSRVREDCPVNVLFIVDGAEEVGDVNTVRRALREAREDGWLRSGVAGLLVSNSASIDDDVPAICYGMRGVIDLEVQVLGADRPLHSGIHGGLVPEPMFDLMALCSSLTDPTAESCVPGFADRVRPPTMEDCTNLQAASRNICPQLLRERLGRSQHRVPAWLDEMNGSAAVEALRRTWLTPALSVTEVGRGPAHNCGRNIAHKAACVISARTTPCQTQEGVIDALQRHLRHEFDKRRSPNRLEIRTLASCDWWEAKTSSHIYRAARSAIAQVWGVEEHRVLAVKEGGTMAVLPALEAELGCDCVQMALSQATSALHLPNERMSAKVLSRSVDTIAQTLVRTGKAIAESGRHVAK